MEPDNDPDISNSLSVILNSMEDTVSHAELLPNDGEKTYQGKFISWYNDVCEERVSMLIAEEWYKQRVKELEHGLSDLLRSFDEANGEIKRLRNKQETPNDSCKESHIFVVEERDRLKEAHKEDKQRIESLEFENVILKERLQKLKRFEKRSVASAKRISPETPVLTSINDVTHSHFKRLDKTKRNVEEEMQTHSYNEILMYTRGNITKFRKEVKLFINNRATISRDKKLSRNKIQSYSDTTKPRVQGISDKDVKCTTRNFKTFQRMRRPNNYLLKSAETVLPHGKEAQIEMNDGHIQSLDRGIDNTSYTVTSRPRQTTGVRFPGLAKNTRRRNHVHSAEKIPVLTKNYLNLSLTKCSLPYIQNGTRNNQGANRNIAYYKDKSLR